MIDKYEKKEIKTVVTNVERKVVKDIRELTDTVKHEVVLEQLHKDLDELKNLKWKEKDKKINDIMTLFSEDAVITYQDYTGGVELIKDIRWFLEDVASWKKTICLSVSLEQYVQEWAITLDSKNENWVEKIQIKKVDLNWDYPED